MDLAEYLLAGGPTLPGMVLTADTLLMMAAVDLLPLGRCPVDGWVPLDCPVLADGLLIRCPCCFRTFAHPTVVFMDDATRRSHGVEVVVEEDPDPVVFDLDRPWRPA
jgi:hypothetical protein